LEKELDKARNVKWILACFEQLSVMKINYEKSDTTSVFLLPICENGMGFGLCGLGHTKIS